MDQQTVSFSIATFNIDQAKVEETHEDTKFDVRWPKLKPMIQEANVDILCLQELRNLETSSTRIPDVLFQIAQMGYDYKHAYYGPDSTSFALAIFYKRDKFFVSGLNLQLLPLADEKKPNVSRIVLMVKLRPMANPSNEFYVCNTHFAIGEQEKEAAAIFLKTELDKITEKGIPFLCAGDFNFFDDRDGAKHRKIMLEGSMSMWSKDRETYPEYTRLSDVAFPLSNASGTFMGFKHDQFNQPFEKMSRLDHIFANKLVKISKQAYAYGDIELVKKREYPSDHLMIVVEVSIY
jgi:endonuclease/exonuclease/phosphatase family metal-dependent hydrolase